MTSVEDFKKQLMEAEKTADKPKNEYHDAARKIVNIERQSFYGDESRSKRLSKIREIVSEVMKKGG